MAAVVPETALPAGFTIRAPRVEDSSEVAALMNARSLADTGMASMAAANILLYWNEPERNLEDEDWLVIAPDGQMVAFMELYQSDPYTVYEFDLQVHPGFVRMGIEQALLDTIEKRVQRDIHRAPAGERVVLHTFAPSTSTEAHALLEAHGYAHIRDGLHMMIDLADVPGPQWPDGIIVRSLVSNQDERAVWEAAEAAWEDHWGYAPMPFDEFLYYRVEAVDNFDPTLWHLAMDGDLVAGVAICRAEPAGFESTGWVSLLGVRREYRGRGIGEALLRHTFADFRSRGYEHVGLGVDASSLTGADRLYRKAGMREISREFIYEKVLVEGRRDRGA